MPCRAQVREAKARGRPYTVVFVGVNGVGKSTNLAKVAYWLLQNDVSARAPRGPPASRQGAARRRIDWHVAPAHMAATMSAAIFMCCTGHL